MGRDAARHSSPPSPFDKYICQALTLIATSGDIPASSLSDVCVRELQWLPGFADVVISMLRTNGLILVNEWEPGKLHISNRGQRWVLANQESISIT